MQSPHHSLPVRKILPCMITLMGTKSWFESTVKKILESPHLQNFPGIFMLTPFYFNVHTINEHESQENSKLFTLTSTRLSHAWKYILQSQLCSRTNTFQSSYLKLELSRLGTLCKDVSPDIFTSPYSFKVYLKRRYSVLVSSVFMTLTWHARGHWLVTVIATCRT
jgi:hypothetical protein